jgi:hypothetical protein
MIGNRMLQSCDSVALAFATVSSLQTPMDGVIRPEGNGCQARQITLQRPANLWTKFRAS